MRPRNFAKVAAMVLDSGVWEEQQVVEADWIAQMQTAQVEATVVSSDEQGLAFGYYWWPVPSQGVTYGIGAGGQSIFLAPAQRLAVVMTTEPYSDLGIATMLYGPESFESLTQAITASLL